MATVFYMLRKLSKAKFDLDSRSFELDAGDPNSEESGQEYDPNEPSPEDLTGN